MPEILAAPIAVYNDVAVCDGKFQHEVNLITDGTHGFAWWVTDTHGLTRSGTWVTATCGQPLHGNLDSEFDPCDGQLAWNIATDAWSTDPEDIEALGKYGEVLES